MCDQVIMLARGKVRLSESLEVLMRPVAPGVTIRTSGDALRLVELIRDGGYSVQQSDATTLFVDEVDVQECSPIWDLSAAAEIGLLSMTPVRNSLEQVFMNAVREEQDADS